MSDVSGNKISLCLLLIFEFSKLPDNNTCFEIMHAHRSSVIGSESGIIDFEKKIQFQFCKSIKESFLLIHLKIELWSEVWENKFQFTIAIHKRNRFVPVSPDKFKPA